MTINSRNLPIQAEARGRGGYDSIQGEQLKNQQIPSTEEKSYTLQSRKRPIFNRRTVFFSAMALMLFGILVFLIIRASSGKTQSHSVSTNWTSSKQKTYANSLFSKGLEREAITAYEKFLEIADAPGEERAKIVYRIGSLYMDIGEYEKSLANLYRVELEHPNTELAADVGQKIVACLERLEMTSQAQYELESRTAIQSNPETVRPGGTVIARIGKDEITVGEIDAALNSLPEWVRKEYESNAAKLEFARQYVANELLYRKAKRLGLDQTPEIRLKIAESIKNLMVRQVIEAELQETVEITPADVQLYYNANLDKYIENAKVELSVIQVNTHEQAEALMTRLKAGEDFAKIAKTESQNAKTAENDGEIPGWISVNGHIPGIGGEEAIWTAIESTDKGGLTDIIEVNRIFYLFHVRDRKPEIQQPFANVKKQVEFDYRRFREEHAAQALLERTLEEQEVVIYDSKFR